MKIGTLAYPTQTGLGYQTRSYIKHLPIDKIMLITGINDMPITNWYDDHENVIKVEGYPHPRQIIEFLRGLDAVLLAETPLNYQLYTLAKDMGVKTVTVINYEFFDHVRYPQHDLPDVFVMPSVWNLETVRKFGEEKGVETVYIHHPVDREEFPFVERTVGKPFHVAGNPASNDRNGTFLFLQAIPNGTVTIQDENMARRLRQMYRHSNIFMNIKDPQTIYTKGDIMVLPRKYGGNCLPLNEALSMGCPVIMPDISPNNHLLPKEWLVPAHRSGHFVPRQPIDLYEVNIDELRYRVDYVRENIKEFTYTANRIAESISWKKLKDKYIEVLS